MSVIVKSASIGPNIVYDGLILYLDAINIKSYPGSGTVWYDLSGNENHGYLYNNPIWNDKYFLFDGLDDYFRTINTLDLTYTQTITIMSVYNVSSINSQTMIYEHTSNWNTNNTYNGDISYGGFGLVTNSNGSINTPNMNHAQLKGNIGYSGSNATYVDNVNTNIHCVIHDFSENGGNETIYYQNGIFIDNSYTEINNTSYFGDDYLFIGKRGSSVPSSSCNIYSLMIYDRKLTINEILKNYNVLKLKY
jgi:hypothetical protein